MGYERACELLGNHKFGAGRQILEALAIAADNDRRMNPTFAEGKYQALGILGDAYWKVQKIIESGASFNEEETQAIFHLMAVCARMVNHEYIHIP